MHSISHTAHCPCQQVFDRWPAGNVKRGYVIINVTVCVTSSTCYSCILLNFFHPWMAAECGGVNKASNSMCWQWWHLVNNLPVIGLSLTPSPLTLDSRPSTGLPSRPTGTMVWLHIVCCTGQHPPSLTAGAGIIKESRWSCDLVVHLCIWLDFKAVVTVETGSILIR